MFQTDVYMYICVVMFCVYIYIHIIQHAVLYIHKAVQETDMSQSCRYVNIQHLPHVVRVLHATFAQLPSTSQTKRCLTPSFSNKRVMNWIDSNNAGCSVVNLNSSVGRMDPIRSISCSWMDPPESAEPLHDLHQKPRNTHLLRFLFTKLCDLSSHFGSASSPVWLISEFLPHFSLQLKEAPGEPGPAVPQSGFGEVHSSIGAPRMCPWALSDAPEELEATFTSLAGEVWQDFSLAREVPAFISFLKDLKT